MEKIRKNKRKKLLETEIKNKEDLEENINAKRLKKARGITLIALIITIIILIILAGITIVALSGENGILKQATEAKDKTEQAQLEEEVNLKILEKETDKNIDKDRGMEEYLNEVQNATVEKLGEGVWLVTRENAEVTVYESGEILEGKIDVWNGSKVEAPEIKEFNWYIYNGAQLKFLADFVNNGNALTEEQKTLVAEKGYNESDIVITDDTIVYLMANIDLGARSTNGELTSGTAWTPIGTTADLKFTGTFEGNNNTIRGVYVNVEKGAGIFGYSDTIQNLTVQDSYIKANVGAGGIVGAFKEGKLINCHNINTIVEVETDRAGGIAGQFQGEEIINCTNNAQVSGKNYYIGGIVGTSQHGTIKGCENAGSVTGNKYVGGITGFASSSTIRPTIIEKSYNMGKVVSKTNSVGGIVGTLSKDSIINNCYNTGEILNFGYKSGGIVGEAASSSLISKSYNMGKVVSKTNHVGGIVGILFGTVEKCYNTGEIISEGKTYCEVGGMAGSIGTNCTAKIMNCYNTGKIVGDSVAIGGIIGWVSETGTKGIISNNYNIGKIEIGENANNVGGIIGRITTDTFTINNNYYIEGTIQTGENDKGESKTAEEMKIQEFVDLLNTGLAEKAWELIEGENENYPVLIDLNS